MSRSPRIETERLLLRTWREADLEPFAALNRDPQVMEYMLAPLPRSQSDALAARIEAHFAEHGYGLFAAEFRESGAFAGFVGLSAPRFDAHFTPCVEIGWRLARPYWGRGIATEGAVACARFAFDELGLDELVSFTVPANQRSIAVMRKLGMRRNPEDDFEHPGVPQGHLLRPHVLYRMASVTVSRQSRATPRTPRPL